jgi:ABC-2 type transport system permease protein
MPQASTHHVPTALAAATLWQRELVRFFRQRSRVVGALATPLMFWAVLGFGLNDAFVPRTPANGLTADAGQSSMGYLAYFFPGMVLLMVLFTAIFSTISVIEDRREGFLQGVLVSPAPRLAIVLGKVLGGASIATVQGAVLLAIWPLVGSWPGMAAMAGAVVALMLIAVGLTALGLCIAWPMDSTAGFHAVMNLFLMPIWFLSGAVFPLATAPTWMQWLMKLNPLTYGHAALAGRLYPPDDRAILLTDGLAWAVTAGAVVVLVALAGWIAARPSRSGR